MHKQKTKAKATFLRAVFSVLTFGVAYLASTGTAAAIDTMADYTAYPPLLNTTSSTNEPNVLVVLDNSNSMDEEPNGVPVGSTSPLSKSELARNAVKDLIKEFTGQIRMGLMTYAQQDIQSATLYHGLYYSSYNPDNYDPTYTHALPLSSWTEWPYELPNPVDSGNYVYYRHDGASYITGTSSTPPSYFCYSSSYTDPAPSGGNTYHCFYDKTGTTDYPTTTGYTNSAFTAQFVPTDSDYAWGINAFGQQLAFLPIGPTWYSDKNPGYGYLDVPVAALTSTQISALDSYLATENLSDNTSPPIQNAGNTPIPGTLLTAKDYFDGTSLDSEEGGPTNAPPANQCSKDDYVVLVTDGLPDVDSSGNIVSSSTAVQDAVNAATALKKDGIITFVVGFALPAAVDQNQLNQIASAGGSGQAYLVSDKTGLNNVLAQIFANIVNSSASGSASAVVTNSANGVGADYQSWYRPSLTDVNASTGVASTVHWIGGLYALFVGPYGYLREDAAGTHQLAGYQTDKIVKFKYDPSTGQTYVIRYDSSSNTIPQNLTPEAPAPLSSLKTIWNAEDPLAELTNVTTNRTNYTDNANTGRYIFTWIDGQSTGTPGVVDTGEVIPFTTTALDSGNDWRYLGVSTQSAANSIIDYIRGEEIPGFRNRSIDYMHTGTNLVWRLGDVIHSTVAVVGAPNADYAVANRDTTYAAFQKQYANRRQMIYVGGNDGMLHAFNGGFWDSSTESFNLTNPSGSATKDPLGSEMWAYVPENLLPQLQWLTSPNYTHVYYMDGPIKTFSARIFTPDAEHPYGWGTVLVAGMRLGGGPYDVDTTGSGTASTVMRSAYVIMDVTDPSQPPKLLAEINDPNSSTPFGMGFTTAMPAVVHAMTPDSSGSYVNPSTNQWYLVFGSGPTNLTDATSSQDAKLYAYDLNTLSFVSGFSPLDLGSQPDSFVGDMSAVDWNLDGVDDGVYFGTVGGTPSAPTGQLDRLVLNSTYSTTPGNLMSGAYLSTLLNPNQPFIAAPSFNTDVYGAHWVYDGTGRMLTVADDSSTAQQSMYGVKEPVDTKGAMTWGTQSVSNLQNVNGYTVYADGTVSPSGNVINGVTVNTVADMEQAIRGMGGWYLNLATNGSAERVVTSPFMFESTLNFATFQPSTDSCDPQGYSWLYAVDPMSGLAQPFAPLGFDSGVTDKNNAEESLSNVSLGYGMAFQGAVHRSTALPSNQATIVLNDSTRSQKQILELGGTLVSGRRSWEQLPLK